MITINAILVGLLGLMVGSFINAVVWRIHEHKPIARDRSECENCHHKLGLWDLIPVFSWLFLKGRCRYCHKPISVQNPLVELLTGGLFMLSYIQLAPVSTLGRINFVVWLYVLGSLIVLSLYDWRWMLLPDVVMMPALLVALIPLVAAIATGQPHQVWLGPIIAALLAGGSFYLLAAVSSGRWMGGGDIKLVALIGLVLGLQMTVVAMFLAFTIAAVVSLGLIATKRKTRRDHIAFGPFLALGCVLAMLYGHQLLNWYNNLLFRG
ncbi:MAG TPA: prepilin peptidase [Candidatus Saccharimonadales bacterium]|nr:prepilin peptidase [Candidatus Saccharimonadales bacterium]